MIEFEQPMLLLLGLVALPLAFIGWRALRAHDSWRRCTIILLRALALLFFAVVLAGPRLLREHDQLTVIGLLDISGSVRRFVDVPRFQGQDDFASAPSIERLRRWFRLATNLRTPDDRFGLIVFDGRAIVISTPVRGDYLDDNLELRMIEGTNIAEAVQLGLALFPADTAKRLVLVTDGNETFGNAAATARLAAGLEGARGVPIDVLPLVYRIDNDVQILRVEAPPNAQPGQTVTVRIVMEALRPTDGSLTLLHEGRPVDLDPASPGTRRSLRVPAGVSVQLAQVDLGETPINRFEAIFEPDDPAHDLLEENNRAQAFTATPNRGLVLFVDGVQQPGSDILPRLFTAADMRVQLIPPEALPGDLLSLQSYDLIIFQNVAAAQVSPERQQLLTRYVNDFGGGFLMIGGRNTFGAGGWNGTPVAEMLPIELDLPKEIRLPRSALVLVIDKSGSMSAPVAGARASQQEVANEGAILAIRSLQQENLVGVVTFDAAAYTHIPLQLNDQPGRMADLIRGISPSGGTNIYPAIERAGDMLRNVEADRKRIVLLTDGHGGDTQSLVRLSGRLREEGVSISTIGVGDGADSNTLAQMAEEGDGQFYLVNNPTLLPRVLLDSVQIINRPLLKERPFVPVVHATGSTLTAGMSAAPPLHGLVITAPRQDAKAILEMSGEEGDPLLARWQVGLGRVAAFTSDAHGDWSRNWIDWPVYTTFWTQLAREITRPNVSQDYELLASVDRDMLQITFDAADPDEGAMDYLQVDATIYPPDGPPIETRLRQTGPGRYQGSVPASMSGNYIIAVSPRRGAERLAPVIGGANQPAGAEYRRYRSNIALLEEIAATTGGRLLDLTDPLRVNLYDRTGLPTSISRLPAWRDLLPWLLALLLLDIAARRIAWDRHILAHGWRAATGRLGARSSRSTRAAATLATLRRRSSELDAAFERQGAGVQRLERNGASIRPATTETPAPAQRSENPVERPATPAAPIRPAEPPRPRDSAAPPNEGDERGTSGLFAAKKRARDRFDDGGDAKPN